MKTIDAVEHIRSHPKMYLPDGVFDPATLAKHLALDAIWLGATHVGWTQRLGWTWVFADRDWIGESPRDVFHEAIPFQQAGPNSMRTEVLLTAFADDVVTFADGSPIVVKSAAGEGALMSEIATVVPGWLKSDSSFGSPPRRAIAFRGNRT